MLGWLRLKFETIWASTLSGLGSSPAPRQQNHLIVTGPPGGMVAGPLDVDGAALGEATGLPRSAEAEVLGCAVAVVPPQAAARMATVAMSAMNRFGFLTSSSLPRGRPSPGRVHSPRPTHWPGRGRRSPRRPARTRAWTGVPGPSVRLTR